MDPLSAALRSPNEAHQLEGLKTVRQIVHSQIPLSKATHKPDDVDALLNLVQFAFATVFQIGKVDAATPNSAAASVSETSIETVLETLETLYTYGQEFLQTPDKHLYSALYVNELLEKACRDGRTGGGSGGKKTGSEWGWDLKERGVKCLQTIVACSGSNNAKLFLPGVFSCSCKVLAVMDTRVILPRRYQYELCALLTRIVDVAMPKERLAEKENEEEKRLMKESSVAEKEARQLWENIKFSVKSNQQNNHRDEEPQEKQTVAVSVGTDDGKFLAKTWAPLHLHLRQVLNIDQLCAFYNRSDQDSRRPLPLLEVCVVLFVRLANHDSLVENKEADTLRRDLACAIGVLFAEAANTSPHSRRASIAPLLKHGASRQSIVNIAAAMCDPAEAVATLSLSATSVGDTSRESMSGSSPTATNPSVVSSSTLMKCFPGIVEIIRLVENDTESNNLQLTSSGSGGVFTKIDDRIMHAFTRLSRICTNECQAMFEQHQELPFMICSGQVLNVDDDNNTSGVLKPLERMLRLLRETSLCITHNTMDDGPKDEPKSKSIKAAFERRLSVVKSVILGHTLVDEGDEGVNIPAASMMGLLHDWDAYSRHHALIYCITRLIVVPPSSSALPSLSSSQQLHLFAFYEDILQQFFSEHLWDVRQDAHRCNAQQLRFRETNVALVLYFMLSAAQMMKVPTIGDDEQHDNDDDDVKQKKAEKKRLKVARSNAKHLARWMILCLYPTVEKLPESDRIKRCALSALHVFAEAHWSCVEILHRPSQADVPLSSFTLLPPMSRLLYDHADFLLDGALQGTEYADDNAPLVMHGFLSVLATGKYFGERFGGLKEGSEKEEKEEGPTIIEAPQILAFMATAARKVLAKLRQCAGGSEDMTSEHHHVDPTGTLPLHRVELMVRMLHTIVELLTNGVMKSYKGIRGLRLGEEEDGEEDPSSSQQEPSQEEPSEEEDALQGKAAAFLKSDDATLPSQASTCGEEEVRYEEKNQQRSHKFDKTPEVVKVVQTLLIQIAEETRSVLIAHSAPTRAATQGLKLTNMIFGDALSLYTPVASGNQRSYTVSGKVLPTLHKVYVTVAALLLPPTIGITVTDVVERHFPNAQQLLQEHNLLGSLLAGQIAPGSAANKLPPAARRQLHWLKNMVVRTPVTSTAIQSLSLLFKCRPDFMEQRTTTDVLVLIKCWCLSLKLFGTSTTRSEANANNRVTVNWTQFERTLLLEVGNFCQVLRSSTTNTAELTSDLLFVEQLIKRSPPSVERDDGKEESLKVDEVLEGMNL